MSDVDDAGLLDRARRGDERAFAELFGRHQRAVYRYAVHLCGVEAGDDIVQETFLAVLQQGGRSDPPRGSVAGYLLGIARHRVWKRLAASGLAAVALDDEAVSAPADASELDALESLSRREVVATVRAAVQSLPVPYREAVVLCDLEEISYGDAAEAIGCPIGTVRSRLHRGRTLLIEKLRPVAAAEAVRTR
jgi:RNA polymerase sigma-70 factor (ECF subfamily)